MRAAKLLAESELYGFAVSRTYYTTVLSAREVIFALLGKDRLTGI